MKLLLRTISIPATIALVAVVHTTFAFSDVAESTKYSQAITALQADTIVEGYSDGTFKPNNTINRAEFLKIILEANPSKLNKQAANCFPDVQTEWFAKYVCSAKKAGIISGYPDGTFKPGQSISFAEASKITALAYEVPTNTYETWYKGYVKALEDAKAIPPSIASMGAFINRGEMAEIIWRVKNEVIDQESTSFLNVENPTLTVNLAADTVQYATTCTDLEAIVKDSTEQQQRVDYFMMEDAVFGSQMPMANSKAQEAPTSGADGSYSETNVQVRGVDEADIVKTDGDYIYALQNNVLTITKLTTKGQMDTIHEENFTKQNDKTTNTSSEYWPTELYVQNGKVILIGTYSEQVLYNDDVNIQDEIAPKIGVAPSAGMRIAPGYYPNYYSSRTQARLYAFANDNLTLERTVALEGNMVSSRLMNGVMYLVVNKGVNWGYPMPLATDSVVPQLKDSVRGADESAVPCNKVAILPDLRDPQYIVVASIPVNDLTKEVGREVIMGNGQNVYMSLNNLYIAQTDWNYSWIRRFQDNETTNIHRFSVNNTKVTYDSSGSVPGQILNQFSMDEYENSFRIATTINNWNNGENASTNNLFVLNKDMELVGEITDIAPGERIYSTRFMGDRTYMVTFKKVDPFFVIDTSEPRNPTILGKLKLPGYSDYLHPYDQNHVLGFGKDAVAAKDADFAWYQGMKIALFDVTDTANPTLKHTIAIGDRGTDSPLLNNHKALLFEKDRNLLAFPVTINKLTNEQKENNLDGNAYGETTFQGALVLDITLEDGFKERGRITHYTTADEAKRGSYYYGKSIERIIRVGNYLYTLSQAGLQSHTEDTVTKAGAVEFTQSAELDYPVLY